MPLRRGSARASRRRTGRSLGVLVTDTFGRSWRLGITNVAIGAAGVEVLRDLRGVYDPAGYELHSTVIAIADEIAAAAELVMGKTAQDPGRGRPRRRRTRIRDGFRAGDAGRATTSSADRGRRHSPERGAAGEAGLPITKALWLSTLRSFPSPSPGGAPLGARRRSSSRTAASRPSSTRSSPSRARRRCSTGSPTRSAISSRTRTCTSTRPTSSSASSCPCSRVGPWTEEVMASAIPYGQGITGWAVAHRSPVLANEAHLDPRVEFVPGTPPDPEALISVPLIARGSLKGALNIYRIGEDAFFDDDEFELARWFGDAAALAHRQRADPCAARAPRSHRLADRPLQPPLLPRAAPLRAEPGRPGARHRRADDARHRRLQARERRVRARRGRRGTPGDRRPAAADRSRFRRRLPGRRRGVRRDPARVLDGGRRRHSPSA